MKRTWMAMFLCLALISGAKPPRSMGHEPSAICPRESYEATANVVNSEDGFDCDYGPCDCPAEAQHASATYDAWRSRHDQQHDACVYGPQPSDDSNSHVADLAPTPTSHRFWDGYCDYLDGLYPYDYYDDTAEVELERSEAISKAPKQDAELSQWASASPATDSPPIEDDQPSPFYGIESSTSDLVAGEYSPLYGLLDQEPSEWAASHDDAPAANSPPSLPLSVAGPTQLPEGSVAAHDDIALSTPQSTELLAAQAPAPTADDLSYQGDDGYWKDDLALNENTTVVEDEYAYDNERYWHGDDNNSPPVEAFGSGDIEALTETLESESGIPYQKDFYQQYGADVRPQYANNDEDLADADDTSDWDGASDWDAYGGELQYEQYGPEYGHEYEYDYGDAADDMDDDGSESAPPWNDQAGTGIDDLYARQSDIEGDTQAPNKSWFDEEAWNESLQAPYESSLATKQDDGESEATNPMESATKSATENATESQDYAPPLESQDDNHVSSWEEGEHGFYAETELPQDYESQWDGTHTPSSQPMDVVDAVAELEATTEAPAAAFSDAAARTRDYWEEFSDYVDPVDAGAHSQMARGAVDHGQYYYGEEEGWDPWEAPAREQAQFLPAHSPLPESYWPEEYQPYDVTKREPKSVKASPSELAQANAADRGHVGSQLSFTVRAAVHGAWWTFQTVPSLDLAVHYRTASKQLAGRMEAGRLWLEQLEANAPQLAANRPHATEPVTPELSTEAELANQPVAPTVAPYVMPYAARVTIEGVTNNDWLQHVEGVSREFQSALQRAHQVLSDQLLPPLEELSE